MPAERRRLFFVHPNNEVGGSDIGLVRLIEALGRERYEATVALPTDGPMTPLLEAAGAAVRVLPMMQLRTLPSPLYQGRYLARMWPTVRGLAGLIRDSRAELVHTNSLYCLYGGFAARVARTPHVWHIREIPPAIPVARPALGRMVLGLSRMVISMTRAVSGQVFGGRAGDPKMRYITEGIDLGVWSPGAVTRSIRDELGIARDALVVGFVARLDPWKGLDVYLDACARVARAFPDAVFLISGDAPAGMEAYRDAMKAKALELGLGERVHFLGWRYRMNDIPALMADLDVFCHTSIAPEPFGAVIMEAMAMGRAVIASREGGPLEIVEHDVSGILCPPRDAGLLADAILSLLRDPARRARLGDGARAQVERRWARPVYAAELRALFDEALAGPLS